MSHLMSFLDRTVRIGPRHPSIRDLLERFSTIEPIECSNRVTRGSPSRQTSARRISVSLRRLGRLMAIPGLKSAPHAYCSDVYLTCSNLEKTMRRKNADRYRIRKFGYGGMLVASLLLPAVTLALAADDRKVETIDATAMGTSTQMGKVVSVKVIIYEYSTDEDRQILIESFKKGQNQGLVNALTKMKSVGRIAITGTIGYDLSYIRLVPTPTGRKIRFVTNRLLRLGEVYYNTQTTAYNLTAGEFDINDSDKDKSAGVLYPASQLVINKEGQLEFQLNKNPWKLVNIIDWNKAGALK